MLGSIGQRAVVAVVALLLVGAAFATGWYANGKRWAGKRLSAELAAAEAIRAADQRAYDAAMRVSAAQSQREVVYRDRVKKIPVYVAADGCSLNADGLRAVACALRPSECAGQPDKSRPSADAAKGR